MSHPSPGTPDTGIDEMGSPEPPESERAGKLASDNARLRSELRQAQARAERAEADAKRVRGSTKFHVGDLLVKAARHPRRLLLLPRDLLRLYRLRGHRRTTASGTDEGGASIRARRSDYTDEVAARLLLPRVAERPNARLAIAGALDPLAAHQWRHTAALTATLPHDGAALVRDVDPDVVVIDTAAAGPFGTWSHLGDPAATDRALAARDLVAAAKAQGRAVMLLRSRYDSPGFDSLATTCDLVVDLPGGPRRSPWHPGIDLGCVARVSPGLLTATTAGDPGDGVLIADADDSTGAAPGRRYDPGIAAAWRGLLDQLSAPIVALSPERPIAPAFEQALRDSAVVAIPLRPGDPIVGASLLALSALATGRRLVSPEDPDLRDLLGLGGHEDARDSGWFTYAAGDQGDACRALESALAPSRPALDRRWRLWRAIFDRCSPSIAWSQALARLGLGADPLAYRRAALLCTDPAVGSAHLAAAVDGQVSIDEIICDRSRVAEVTAALKAGAGELPRVIGIDTTGDDVVDRSRAAQASGCPLLIEVAPDILTRGLGPPSSSSANALRDAVIAYELSDAHDVVDVHDVVEPHDIGVPGDRPPEAPGPVRMRVIDRTRALAGALAPPLAIACPSMPGAISGESGTATGDIR